MLFSFIRICITFVPILTSLLVPMHWYVSGERRVIAMDGDSADLQEDRPHRVDVFGATTCQDVDELLQEQNFWWMGHCLQTMKDDTSDDSAPIN